VERPEADLLERLAGVVMRWLTNRRQLRERTLTGTDEFRETSAWN